jgi:hypothetical protein
VNRSCLGLVLECLQIWAKKEDEDVEVNSWALFKALVFGGQYGLLRDVFPLAFFRFDWEQLRSYARRRFADLIPVVLLHDNPAMLYKFFGTLLDRHPSSLDFYKFIVERNCPSLLRHFLSGGGSFPLDLLPEVFLHDHSSMWEVALLQVPPLGAYAHALEHSRLHTLSFLSTKLKPREKDELIEIILRLGDAESFRPVWGSFGCNLEMFHRAWEKLQFVDLPPLILKRVAEHCGHLKNTIELVSFTSHLARDIRYLPLVEHLPREVLNDFASDLLEAEVNGKEYFDSLLGLCREDITGCLFDAVVGAGNVPFFLRAHEQFSTLKVDLKHMLSLLRHGAVEILTALLPRYALDADVVKLAHQIAASEKCHPGMKEAARLVLTDPRARQC